MLKEILLALVQAATEFLPVSSSGHLALISNLISEVPDLFFFTVLHLASLAAVIIFTRREIAGLLSFKKEYRRLWIYLIIATIPAGIVGYFLRDLVEASFSSLVFLGIAFIFTGSVLFLTRFSKVHYKLGWKNSIFIGLFQALALFPGISRSGMTISAGLFSGIDREKAAKFSFLLFIPLSLGAFLLELGSVSAYFSFSLLVAFIITLIFSLIFLNLLIGLIKRGSFWVFSFYCWLVGLISLIIYFA